jgi:hypothetical protein
MEPTAEETIKHLESCLNKAHKLINPARLEESTAADFLLQLESFVEESNEHAKAAQMYEARVRQLETEQQWISVEDIPLPDSGDCLVYLEGRLGREDERRYHVANCHENVTVVGNHFILDMPKVTHWRPLPSPPVITTAVDS